MVTTEPELSVVLLGGGPRSTHLDTLKSLQQQTGVHAEFLVGEELRLEDGPANEVAQLERAIAEARAPYLTVVRSGERLMHGALAALLDACKEHPGVGVVHTWWFPLPQDGLVSESGFLRRRERLGAFLPAGLRHRNAMLVLGNVVQGLPTFQLEILRAAGPLERGSLEEALYLAALRAIERGDATIIPRLLCGRPTGSGSAWDLAGPRPYWSQLREYRRAQHERSGKSWHRLPSYVRLVATGLTWRLALRVAPARSERTYLAVRRLTRAKKPWRRRLHLTWPYRLLAASVRQWPLSALAAGRRSSQAIDGARVGYFRLVYPKLSETFVRREISVLRNHGLELEVFARETDSPFPEDPASPAGTVTYLGSPEEIAGQSLLGHLWRTKPWRCLQVYLFAVRHPYRGEKTWKRDRSLVHESAQLAGAFLSRGITHAHSPFADRGAALCLMAARLVGITCSVQARASELHRFAETEGAIDCLRMADFVITNSRYNERFLRSRLTGRRAPPIHTIYNGLDLERFEPGPRASSSPARGPLRIVSVGRLIEPKGFSYLLRSIRLVRDRGIDLHGEIIGGPEDSMEPAAWLELRLLHQELGLLPYVQFQGEQPFSQVLAAYRRADLFALACVAARSGSHDITPNALIEAMAMGLPVISTTSGAIPEIVENEASGLLVNPGDAEALADAIERLARNPSLREQLGRAARRVIEERFDGSRNVEPRLILFGRRG